MVPAARCQQRRGVVCSPHLVIIYSYTGNNLFIYGLFKRQSWVPAARYQQRRGVFSPRKRSRRRFRALSKVDGCVPQLEHASLRIVGQRGCTGCAMPAETRCVRPTNRIGRSSAPPRPLHRQPPERDQIAILRSLVCTGAHQIPAAYGTNQGT